MDDDLADVARVLQSNVIPGLAAVVRTIDASAEGDVAANAGFAGADINYIGTGVGDRDAADGGGGLLIEEGIPGNAAVRSLPNAAGGGAKIVSVRLAWNTSYGKGPATTEWADEAPFHSAVDLRIDRAGARGLCGLLRT